MPLITQKTINSTNFKTILLKYYYNAVNYKKKNTNKPWESSSLLEANTSFAISSLIYKLHLNELISFRRKLKITKWFNKKLMQRFNYIENN